MKKIIITLLIALSSIAYSQVKSEQLVEDEFTTLRSDGLATSVDSGMAGTLYVNGVFVFSASLNTLVFNSPSSMSVNL